MDRIVVNALIVGLLVAVAAFRLPEEWSAGWYLLAFVSRLMAAGAIVALLFFRLEQQGKRDLLLALASVAIRGNLDGQECFVIPAACKNKDISRWASLREKYN